MSFMTSYKHLEKLCGEVMGDQRRLSAYIEEMERKSIGARYVAGWDEDLRNLKHYRWVRNQIVHDPECDEEDLCAPWDAQWLEDFYDRIMDQTDPLTLYRKATQPQSSPAPSRPAPQPPVLPQNPVQPQPRRSSAGCAMLLASGLALLALLLI